MLSKETKTSISEDDGELSIVNENGKRPAEDEKDGKKRIKTKSLYRQPTVKELNRLQETESLFNSNLFRLQVEEVLQEVKVKEKTSKRFQEWFAAFKNHLLAIPDDDTEYDLTEKVLSKHLKVKLPVSSSLSKTKAMFKFHKFTVVDIVGSYALGTAINSKLVVDVQITTPADVYTKNDSINYRYHKKRAAYLACIASHLNKFEGIENINYVYLNGSEIKPLLELKLAGKIGNHLSVRINLVCEEEAYKLHRFSPGRNNLRESWLFDHKQEANELGPPTPYYNSSILSDITAAANQQFLKETYENCENLRQAVILLKIWLRQRKLAVSGHVVSLFVAYLVQIKRINNIMSSYQIVRNVWIALKSSEWDTKGISLHKGQGPPPLEEFLQHFPVVFLDRTGYYNICWQMCKGTYCALRRESELAVDMLDNGKINSFIPLFMTPVVPLMQFDHILRFKNLPKLMESVIERTPKEARINYGVDQLALVTDVIHSLLTKGLGDRVHLILQNVEADFSWPVKKTLEKAKENSYEPKLSFGFIMNTENSMNIVDKGPPANLPESEEFRAFWGNKSELRRFQDGTITEACVWSADSLAERRAVTKQILDYLFHFKYDVPSSSLFHICDQVESVTARKAYGGLQAEEAALTVLQVFDQLRRDMRSFTHMPLDVSAVYGVSPVFSYSDPCPALGSAAHGAWRRGVASLIKDKDTRLPEYTPANHVIVELGHSGKWPGDIEAFRCLKAAFNLQIADCLTKQYSLPAQAYPTHIDVLKNGLVFSLHIAHPKEITLLRRGVEGGVVRHTDTEESVKLHCDTVLLPRLRGALHGLHQKYPAYGPTVCLFKRWLSSHLLSPPHFPPLVAELLTAATFAHAHPLSPPYQPTVGLVRVLRTLVDTDWRNDMILLDFNDDMTPEEISSVREKFTARESLSPYMYIATAYDGDSPSVWSGTGPSRAVASRAQALAKATLGYLEKALLDDFKDNVLDAFVPSLSGYDVLIYLHCSLVPYATERVDRKPLLKTVPHKLADDVIPVVEFNPVEKYLHELRSAYSEFAVFFHDSYGGDVIAVLWTPDIHQDRELQIASANALKPVKSDAGTKYKVNIEALVEDFRILGDGLVKDIVVNS